MQLKARTSALLRFAKKTGIPVILVGHVTKSGEIAGPRILEHIVDVVLYLEGEKYSSHRLLRAVKNHLGSIDEPGIFEMSQLGLEAVSSPSEMFLSGDQHSDSEFLAGLAVAVIMDASCAFLIEIQALCVSGSTASRHVNVIQPSRADMIISVLNKQVGLKIQENVSYYLYNPLRITKSMEEPSKNSKIGAFTSSEIVEITSNFKTMIGKGGFGEVYLGTLKDGIDVAVKVLLSSLEQCHKTFLAEAKLLTVVHHKNLVSLVGYCDEDGKEALIYDYIPNGNLKQHLSEKSKTTLIWIERLQVALDVACGLEYLHGRKPPIIHRDLKPDNILFNEYMQAKIADFGVSKAFATESASYISTHPAGTPG
ncbi:hypothetical protein SLE2022_309770 [Rubroshorea leprosula]